LLIVGGDDTEVLQLNRQAFEQLPAEKRLVIIPGASHLFLEPGKLEEVAGLARQWFQHYLAPDFEEARGYRDDRPDLGS
jgi:hypothetical protein